MWKTMIKIRVRVEWVVIKSVFKDVKGSCKKERSLRPIGRLLFTRQPYRVSYTGKSKSGNYYGYVKDEVLAELVQKLEKLREAL